jgi:hypothetical protein
MTDAVAPADAPENQSVAAQLAPQTRLDRILAVVPRALSSHARIIFLGLHARHDVLEKGMEDAMAASERAEAAALRAAGGVR